MDRQRVDHEPALGRRVEVGRGIGPHHPFVDEMDVDFKENSTTSKVEPE